MAHPRYDNKVQQFKVSYRNPRLPSGKRNLIKYIEK